MAQNDIKITTTPPLPGLTLVQGVNGALQSLATDFAGSVDPAAIDGVGPYCTWADTGNGLLKRRNAAGTDWVVEGSLFLNAGTDHAGTEPSNPVPFMRWADVANNLLKQRNAANTDWVVISPLLEELSRKVGRTAIISTSSGTAIDVTAIPGDAHTIEINFVNVSTSGAGLVILRLGTDSSFATAGYNATAMDLTNATPVAQSDSSGFPVYKPSGGSDAMSGRVTLSRPSGSSAWSLSGVIRGSATRMGVSAGYVTLGNPATRIRLTTPIGTDTFDSGLISVSWEF